MIKLFGKTWVPWATLTVNVVGCFIIGLITGLSLNKQLLSPEMNVFIYAGLLGGFTTFSTFGLEIVLLSREDLLHSGAVLISNIILGCWRGCSGWTLYSKTYL